MPDIFLHMQEEKDLVSIVVPVYNTGEMLLETVNSVLGQSYENFELILIDDGSTASPMHLLSEISDRRIRTLEQANQGMAQTRNNGLDVAKGEFVQFLDHDDVLTPDFLKKRVECMRQNTEVGFVGGTITTFSAENKEYLSAAEDIESEILFFNPNYLTTTSSYLIRRSVLSDNDLRFNPLLSSTADRFMLLQLNKVTKGKRVEGGKLMYRVSASGFSQTMSPKLIADNELFLEEVVKHNLVPSENAGSFYALNYFMLAGCHKKMGNFLRSAKYLSSSLAASPTSFFKRIFAPQMVINKEVLKAK